MLTNSGDYNVGGLTLAMTPFSCQTAHAFENIKHYAQNTSNEP